MRQTTASLLIAITAGAVFAPSALAQNWMYNPYTGASTWLTVARSIAYPFNRLSGSGTPFYLANNLIWAGSYAADQAIRNKQRQYMYGQYYDEEPYYNPRRRTRAAQNGAYDQIVSAQRMGQQSQGDDEEDFPAPRNPNEWRGPVPSMGATPGVAGMGVPNPAIASAPPVVPQHTASGYMPQPAPSVQPSGSGAPLAQGFIHVVNSRFHGDIGKALSDSDTANYARAIGLINSTKYDGSKISSEKRRLIKEILSDSRESADVRINAVRVMLKH